jgi:polyhydroxybutyrate depolymerase
MLSLPRIVAMNRIGLSLLFILLTASTIQSAEPKRVNISIDDVAREALLYVPMKTDEPLPVVFAFHGHGGNAMQASRSFRFQEHWPEALVVYMQGLPTPGQLTDPEGKRNGWQRNVGDQNDRDLKFFDALLAQLKKDYKIDDRRIYSTGHSNGGGFTYLLWSARGDQFAAFAPSAAAARYIPTLKPKPAMHIAGENDPLVKYQWQQAAMAAVRIVNGCEETGKEWAPQCMLYPSKHNAPFVALIHPGDHKYLQEATPLIVKFFKEQRLTETSPSKPAE